MGMILEWVGPCKTLNNRYVNVSFRLAPFLREKEVWSKTPTSTMRVGSCECILLMLQVYHCHVCVVCVLCIVCCVCCGMCIVCVLCVVVCVLCVVVYVLCCVCLSIVFLGGSCNPTTWRQDVAIPTLGRARVTYYNPVSIELDMVLLKWSKQLIQLCLCVDM